MANHGKIEKAGKIIFYSVFTYGLATILFGLSKSFTVSFIALMMIGASDGVSSIIRNIIRQLETPDHIRGRITSINMIFFISGPQLGEFEAGLFAAAVGGPTSVFIGGIATLVAVSITYYLIPSLRDYESPS